MESRTLNAAIAAVVTLCIAASAPAAAGTVTLQAENDFYYSDKWFTNGFYLSFVSDEICPSGLLPKACASKNIPDFLEWYYDAILGRRINAYHWSVAVGQNIYTPEDIAQPGAIAGDRPYAGWLYLSLGFFDKKKKGNTTKEIQSLELSLGVVGPGAQADHAQDTWHKWFGLVRPQGWDNQLKNEPAINVFYEEQYPRKWRTKNPQIQIIPRWSVAAGTVFDYVQGGAVLRFGWNLQDDPLPLIRPSGSGTGYIPDFNGISFYGFLGVSGRAVAHDIFLDGGTFRNGPNVNKRNVVGELQAGVALTVGENCPLPICNWRIAYTEIRRTQEFRGQADPYFDFRALTLSKRF